MRGLVLNLVHAWDEPLDLSVDLSPDALPGLHGNATAYAVHGPAAAALLAHPPELLVLGRHTGARRLSHVTRSCLRNAACPVVIVPHAERPLTGRVLVGVRCGETSRNALRWAAGEAQRRLAELVVVHAWQLHLAQAIPAQREAAHDRLAAWVYSVLGNVNAELNAIHGGPLDALLRLSADADLIVVGRSRHWGLGRALLGAVGTDLSGLAPCPIALIPSQSRPASAGCWVYPAED
jgi:nucleotide-binding universal stress UspA family protein